MLGHIGQLGFFDEALIPDGVSYLSAFRILETEGLKGLTDALRREIRARKVDLLVLDGLVSAEETAGTRGSSRSSSMNCRSRRISQIAP